MDNAFNRVTRNGREGQGGFTLIELLVVIAVLAALAAIVIFNIAGVTNKGKTSACQTDLQTIQTAVDAYYNHNSNVYPDAAAGGDTATPANGDTVSTVELQTDNLIHAAPTSTGALTYHVAVGVATGTIKAANC